MNRGPDIRPSEGQKTTGLDLFSNGFVEPIDKRAELTNKLNDLRNRGLSGWAIKLALDNMFDDPRRPNGNLIEHMIRSVELGEVFIPGGKKVLPGLLDLQLLHDLYGRLTHSHESDGGDKLRLAYLQAYEGISKKRRRRLRTMLADQVRIGEGAKIYRSGVSLLRVNQAELDDDRTTNIEELSGLQQEAMRSGYPGELTAKEWQTAAPAIDWKSMKKLIKQVNIESIVVKAVEMLDNLKNPPSRPLAQLHDVLEAESFYIPILKVIGFDALAMEIYSSCKLRRLVKQGEKAEEAIEKAKELYRQAEGVDPAEVIKDALGLERLPEIHWTVDQTNLDVHKGVNCRSGEARIEMAGRMVRVKFRQKSIGSLAEKILRKGDNYYIMDVFGITVVAGDEAWGQKRYYEIDESKLLNIKTEQLNRLVNAFEATLNKVGGKLQFQASSTEKGTVHYQGDQEFNNRVGQAIGNPSLTDKKISSRQSNYRVAKFTALVQDVPTEVQFVTDFDRQLARIGVQNHDIYKNGDREDLTVEDLVKILKSLRAIYKRVEHFGSKKLNPRSRKLGKIALRQIRSGVYRGDKPESDKM